MTVVQIFRNPLGITGFVANGHTGYAKRGEDIVCAAVSVLTQTAVIGLQDVVNLQVDLEIKDGFLKCMLPSDLPDELWKESQLVLNVIYKGLKAIVKDYSNFLRIEEVESCK